MRLARGAAVSVAELTVRRPPDGPGLAAWSLLSVPASRHTPPGGLANQAAFEDLTRSLVEAGRVTGMDLEIALVELGGLLGALSDLTAEQSAAATSVAQNLERMTALIGALAGVGSVVLVDVLLSGRHSSGLRRLR